MSTVPAHSCPFCDGNYVMIPGRIMHSPSPCSRFKAGGDHYQRCLAAIAQHKMSRTDGEPTLPVLPTKKSRRQRRAEKAFERKHSSGV